MIAVVPGYEGNRFTDLQIRAFAQASLTTVILCCHRRLPLPAIEIIELVYILEE